MTLSNAFKILAGAALILATTGAAVPASGQSGGTVVNGQVGTLKPPRTLNNQGATVRDHRTDAPRWNPAPKRPK